MTLNIPNLDKLIAHLEAQPAERINMGWCQVRTRHECGTAGCIIGHAQLLFGLEGFLDDQFEAILGLSVHQRRALTMPSGWDDEKTGVKRYPAHRVIATLKRLRDHYLATGEIVVDWGPEPTAGEPWAAPQAVELKEPALPAEITQLLSLAPATETSGA